jgi:fucose 4-O-acetylase-like acetyltransferase
MADSWFARLPDPVKNYFVPSSDGFSMFPWAAFLAFGVAAGSLIPLVERRDWSRVMQWSALVGFAAVAAGEYFANLPWSIYPNSQFWLNSPSLIACKMGITLLLAAGAYLWNTYFADGWSWITQLGTTSLAVYWVHIELVYGRWFARYRDHLTAWGCVGVAVVLIAAMLGMSVAITRWRRRKAHEPAMDVSALLTRGG